MPERTEQITIKRCPKCLGKHTYQLTKNTVLVLHLADTEKGEKLNTITHLFNCPSTGGTFQAKLNLRVSSGERLESVTVKPSGNGG